MWVPPRTMDAITLLRSDHTTVEQLFKRFEKVGDRAYVEKRQIVDRIIEELSMHAAIEEQCSTRWRGSPSRPPRTSHWRASRSTTSSSGSCPNSSTSIRIMSDRGSAYRFDCDRRRATDSESRQIRSDDHGQSGVVGRQVDCNHCEEVSTGDGHDRQTWIRYHRSYGQGGDEEDDCHHEAGGVEHSRGHHARPIAVVAGCTNQHWCEVLCADRVKRLGARERARAAWTNQHPTPLVGTDHLFIAGASRTCGWRPRVRRWR